MANDSAPNRDHGYEIVTRSAAGEVLHRDSDFAEDARLDWFDQTVTFADSGETIQLVERETGTVIEEKLRDSRAAL